MNQRGARKEKKKTVIMCRVSNGKIQGSSYYTIPRRVGTEGTFFDCFLLWEKKNQGTRWRMGVGKWRDKLTTNWAGVCTVGSVSIFFFLTASRRL